MTGWTPQELTALAETEEWGLAPHRRDTTLRTPTTIWGVRVGDDIYVRSWRGAGGHWYRAAQRTRTGRISAAELTKDVRFVEADTSLVAAIDEAYRLKYRRYAGSYLEPMLQPQAQAATLTLLPR
ncbi:hypothetical protein BIV57_00310 [Mangrovactinospora gilvigrisea]|uniref:DUF2255 domain-containing protein n=1 Tax=Mangrovactinospora gilvigrisea TaxID=1428644 RepID=A0A1J7BKW8_9ACTN|nr:DUF2255 family protein [Mangrovactinospora gilvigrisea]OIV39327.1 hypothetical protein BIV57_00310 [Mangrovactinospora gilvigrisea]